MSEGLSSVTTAAENFASLKARHYSFTPWALQRPELLAPGDALLADAPVRGLRHRQELLAVEPVCRRHCPRTGAARCCGRA